jgi:hypothetical protein
MALSRFSNSSARIATTSWFVFEDEHFNRFRLLPPPCLEASWQKKCKSRAKYKNTFETRWETNRIKIRLVADSLLDQHGWLSI